MPISRVGKGPHAKPDSGIIRSRFREDEMKRTGSLCLLVLACSACTVISVAGTAVSTAASVTGTVISTTASVAGTAIEATADVAGAAVRGVANTVSPPKD